MLGQLLLVLCLAATSLAGTMCPPRDQIYPCSCANVIQSKKLVHTLVICHKIHDTDQLNGIFPYLRTMQIDQLFLYDSFWQAQLEGGGEDKRVLSSDWMALLKVKEMEIVDTALASCFACEWKIGCGSFRNTITTRFTAINSSSSDKICTLCDTGKGNKYPWTGCMSKLRHFHFSHGKLTTVGSDLFPVAMTDLLVLNLTHNHINKVDPNAFKNLPRLAQLDLSHNAIEHLTKFFGVTTMRSLEFLDVSWNSIKEIGVGLIPALPFLKTLKLNSNVVVSLKENEWKGVNDSLKVIDLDDNPLHCDCAIRWVNSTFHMNTLLTGTCASPPDYENSPVRRSSRNLVERCDADGNIGTRPPKTTPSSKIF